MKSAADPAGPRLWLCKRASFLTIWIATLFLARVRGWRTESKILSNGCGTSFKNETVHFLQADRTVHSSSRHHCRGALYRPLVDDSHRAPRIATAARSLGGTRRHGTFDGRDALSRLVAQSLGRSLFP